MRKGTTFAEFINRLYQQDIVPGYPCGNPEPCDSEHRPYYRPGNQVTRQQMAKFVDQARHVPGIYIETSTDLLPLYSRTTAPGGFAVMGLSPSGIGVFGTSANDTGVEGHANWKINSANTCGLFGHYLLGDSRKGKVMMSKQVAPGPRRSILLGSVRDFQRDPLRFLEDAADVYGDIVRFRLGPHRVYLVNHPDYIYELLVTQSRKIRRADLNRNILASWLGYGIVTSDGDVHRQQRRLVQPAFHHQHITAYTGAMVEFTLQMLNNWQAGESYDIDDEMMKLTMDIVSATLFGADVSKDASKLGGAVATLQHISIVEFKAGFMIPEWIPVPRNRRRRAATKVVNDTVLGFIRERRASGEHKGDLLSMLLQAQYEDGGKMMTDEQVRDEAVTLFVAGHETVSNALTWTWYLLSQNPDVEMKLHAELDRVLGGRPPTLPDLPELKYTEMVVKEAMRRYPPAWILMTRTPLETVTVGGYQIDPGEWIFISPYVMHHSPRYFEDPQRFDPERFTEGREKELPRYAYFPFGGGQRVCIGNSFAMVEMRLILATVAQQYKLILEPGQEIVPEPEITLRPKYGLHMTASTRTLPSGASQNQRALTTSGSNRCSG